MSVILRILCDVPVESIDHALQTSLDQAGKPICILVNGEVVMNERQIQAKSAEMN